MAKNAFRCIYIWLAIALVPACGWGDSDLFTPPRFSSLEVESNQLGEVLLRCSLSDDRVEHCGFLYGVGERLDNRLECELSGLDFEAKLTGLDDGAVYSFCAYATAGDAEIHSETRSFRPLSRNDPIPIEDPVFKSWLVQKGYDTDGDGEISYKEAESVSTIEISPSNKYNLQSLKGIEYMPNLEVIDCPGKSLWSGSKPGAINSQYYYVGPYSDTWSDSWGPIGTLRYADVSNNPKLRYLNLRANSALGVEMGIINVSNCPLLTRLDVSFTWLEYPDVSTNTELDFMQFSHLRGTLPDFSRLTKVKALFIEWPQDKQVELVDLDVSHMPNLETLYVAGRIKSLSDLSANPKLINLYMWNLPEEFGQLNLSVCSDLEVLTVNYSNLQSLDVSQNTELKDLDCRGNMLTVLNVSNNTLLKSLHCVQKDNAIGINYLQTLFIAQGQTIPFVTVNRSTDYIPEETKIVTCDFFPPDNEIWYTTVSGGLLSGGKNGFAPSVYLLSNTYEGGKGVLRFSGDITEIVTEAFSYNSDLKTLVIPSGVRYTSYSSFRECVNLTSIVFAPGLEVLGDTSLHNCQKLTEVPCPPL